MGAGTCVVVNGIPEQLETIGDAGVHYKVNDLNDLTRKLQELVDNPDLRDRYAKRTQKRVMKYYRWDDVIDRYEGLLKETAGLENSNGKVKVGVELAETPKEPVTSVSNPAL